MSNPTLKKHLQTLTKEQIIEQVPDLYDYYLNPNEKEQFEKHKATIVNEFYPKEKYAEFPYARITVFNNGNFSLGWQRHTGQWAEFFEDTLAGCLKYIAEDNAHFN